MDIRDTFDALDHDRVHQFVAERQEEHLLLDFKTVNKPDFSDAADRRSLAIALSGFANASGGIIVWGVDARKPRPDDADCAVGLREIPDLALFLSRLNEHTALGVRPAVPNVLHRAIPTADGGGFAATYVEASDLTPHMALAREGRYYRRAGASFLPMEHYEIADMFGARRRAVLVVTAELRGGGGQMRSGGLISHYRSIILVLGNEGRGSARGIFVEIAVSEPYAIGEWGVDGNRNEGLPRIVPFTNRAVRYGGSADRVLHPGMSIDLNAIAAFTGPIREDMPDLRIRVRTAADDIPLQEHEVVVPGALITSHLW